MLDVYTCELHVLKSILKTSRVCGFVCNFNKIYHMCFHWLCYMYVQHIVLINECFTACHHIVSKSFLESFTVQVY